jgi:hypothetical protein
VDGDALRRIGDEDALEESDDIPGKCAKVRDPSGNDSTPNLGQGRRIESKLAGEHHIEDHTSAPDVD